ncbi:Uma2 family endonuclease [Vacuolonema iberomarrocanum]|uniref:Uma2 family endonuclease n=1 Tax=Vacuolonema iberomarrocanum TaxID=3454632 RepID=UPI003F6DEC84
MTFGIQQSDLEARSLRPLPTMYDLPSEFPEEPGLPDEFHDLQPQLLSRTLSLAGWTSDRRFTASDLNVYYDVYHPLWHKRPDWFLVLDVPRLYEGQELRRSYVTWQEGRNPYVAIEFLSPGTEAEDLGRFAKGAESQQSENGQDSESPPGKLDVYERYLRIPHYLVYSRYTQQLRYFKLIGGSYEEQPLSSATPLVWLEDLDIGLGIWEGTFEGIPGHWLRWCDRQGNWCLTDTESERQKQEETQSQLLQAARNLIASGTNLEDVTRLLQLTDEQIRQI